MITHDAEILSDEEIDELLEQNPKAARAYMKMLNQLLQPGEPQVAPITPPALSAEPAGLPALETLTRLELTIWDNADANGKRLRNQTRYKAELKAWTIDCAGVRAPRHQWCRNTPLYEKWPFTKQFDRRELSTEYVAALNVLVDHGSPDALFGMIGDKVGGTNFYDRQAIMIDLPAAAILVGDDILHMPPFATTQAGTVQKRLHEKIAGQSRWSRDPSNWSTDE